MKKAPKERPRGAGRVAFLARVEDFRKLVNAGHPVVAIYQEHGKDLGISYSQFSRYVARYIRSQAAHDQDQPTGFAAVPAREVPPQPAARNTPAPTADKPQGRKAGSEKPRFEHRATSGNERDDLI